MARETILVVDDEKSIVELACAYLQFDVLLALARHKGVVLSREQLLNVAWGYEFYGETRTVDVHVAHVRNKLQGSGITIETVWGVGYKLAEGDHPRE